MKEKHLIVDADRETNSWIALCGARVPVGGFLTEATPECQVCTVLHEIETIAADRSVAVA